MRAVLKRLDGVCEIVSLCGESIQAACIHIVSAQGYSCYYKSEREKPVPWFWESPCCTHKQDLPEVTNVVQPLR